jgi:hypothetical protein
MTLSQTLNRGAISGTRIRATNGPGMIASIADQLTVAYLRPSTTSPNRMITAANRIAMGPCSALQQAMTDQAAANAAGGAKRIKRFVRPISSGLKVSCR